MTAKVPPIDIRFFYYYIGQLRQDIDVWIGLYRDGMLSTEQIRALVELLERSALTLREVEDG